MRVGPIVSSLIGEGGLLTEEKVNYVLEHQELQIVEDLFAKDALVMEHDQAHEVSLIAPDGNPYVTVAFEAPLFGIWAPKGGKAPFVCIEPWYGSGEILWHQGKPLKHLIRLRYARKQE